MLMKVSSIEKQKNNKRCNVFIDGEYVFSASMEDVIKYSIEEGKEFGRDEIDEIIEKCEFSKAYERALVMLDKKDYLEIELIKKLKLLKYTDKTISKVIEKLKSYDFIDDDRYIKRYINDCISLKKFGKRKILYNLAQKGLTNIDADSIYTNSEMEYHNALELAEKKLKLHHDEKNPKEKIYKYLLSKGYEYDTIKRVINKLFNSFDSIEA